MSRRSTLQTTTTTENKDRTDEDGGDQVHKDVALRLAPSVRRLLGSFLVLTLALWTRQDTYSEIHNDAESVFCKIRLPQACE